MNQSEALLIVEIVVGFAAGLAAIYFGGKVILNGLRSRRGSSGNIVSSALPDTFELPTNTGSSHVSGRDQRPTTFQPRSNRGSQHSRTRRGNKYKK